MQLGAISVYVEFKAMRWDGARERGKIGPSLRPGHLYLRLGTGGRISRRE